MMSENDTPNAALRGNAQDEARHSLNVLNRDAFDNDAAQLALALGRPPAEISAMLTGTENIDDDLLMKVHGLAEQRGVTLS